MTKDRAERVLRELKNNCAMTSCSNCTHFYEKIIDGEHVIGCYLTNLTGQAPSTWNTQIKEC